MRSKHYKPRRLERRGTVIVQVAVLTTFIMGLGALAIDVGSLYTVQAELQAMADASALAAAGQLASTDGDPVELATQVAEEYASENAAMGVAGGLDMSNDLVFGKAVFNASTGRFEFTAGGDQLDAVRVTARRSSGSSAGPVQLMFGNVFGKSSSNLQAQAAATLVPRDMAVVIDLSRSMTYDSELRRWQEMLDYGGYSNLRDCWAALDGPLPNVPYIPGPEHATQYAGDLGPQYGLLGEWGDPLEHGYSPWDDPGLYYIPQYPGSSTDARFEAKLAARGYSTEEIQILLEGPRDDVCYWNRVKVLLELADWKSGIPGGKFEGDPDVGNGNDWIGDGELSGEIEPDEDIFGNLEFEWYFDSVDSGQATYYGWDRFRYFYGAKTLTDYVMEKRCQHSKTPALAGTPQQPLRAVKDATQAMTDYIEALDSPDKMSLLIYGTTAPPPEVYLTADIQQTPTRLYEMQAGHYDVSTNLGGGMARAIAELKNPDRARGAAKKVMVVMSDGQANVGEDGLGGKDYAKYQAEVAADEGIVIYTISVGYGVDRATMQEIAQIGRGQEFYAEGNPEEYSAELRDIFRSLGAKRPVVLIE